MWQPNELSDPAREGVRLQPERDGRVGAWLDQRFLVACLIFLLTDLSGKSLDDGKTTCDGRKDKTDRNARPKQARRNNMPPSICWLAKPERPKPGQQCSREQAVEDSMQPNGIVCNPSCAWPSPLCCQSVAPVAAPLQRLRRAQNGAASTVRDAQSAQKYRVVRNT